MGNETMDDLMEIKDEIFLVSGELMMHWILTSGKLALQEQRLLILNHDGLIVNNFHMCRYTVSLRTH